MVPEAAGRSARSGVTGCTNTSQKTPPVPGVTGNGGQRQDGDLNVVFSNFLQGVAEEAEYTRRIKTKI
jgi:hypothetical protein